MNHIIGQKKMMASVFDDSGKNIPVTVVDLSSSVVALKADNGYELGVLKKSKVNSALRGKYKELGYVPQRRYFVTGDQTDLAVGDKLPADMFEVGTKVSVMSTSKGKGFAGVVKRWNFAGGPASHGQSDRERAPGSIGAGTDPGRVLKGKKMAGRMGGARVTVKNLKIVGVGDDYILVSGSIPGPNDSVVIISKED